VLDRLIQQAVDAGAGKPSGTLTFSETSFGFRRKRSAHQAVERAQAQYRVRIITVVVDIDWRSSSTGVNHDILMGAHCQAVADKRILKLDPRLFDRGCDGGRAGQPDGGRHAAGWTALAAMSNLMLDVLDKETGEARSPLRALRRRLCATNAPTQGGAELCERWR